MSDRATGGDVSPLTVALVPGPDQVVVRLTGDADLSTAPIVADALNRAAGPGVRQVVVDVAGASFWDCSGLHALADFTGELAAAGRSCRIVGALAHTRRLIGLAHLTDRLVLDGALPTRQLPAPRSGAPAPRPSSGHPVPWRGAATSAAGVPAHRD